VQQKGVRNQTANENPGRSDQLAAGASHVRNRLEGRFSAVSALTDGCGDRFGVKQHLVETRARQQKQGR
jgi:hypothetical protein